METSGNPGEIPKKLGIWYPTVYRKFETNITRNETARPLSSFYIPVSMSHLYILMIDPPFFAVLFVDRSWEYINRSQIHECRNWEWGRTVSFRGIFVSNFRDSAFAVQPLVEKILGHVSRRRRTTPATQLCSLLVNGKFRKLWWDIQETWYMIPHTLPKIRNKLFPEKKLRVLVPYFYIPVSVSDFYIPTIGLPILLYCFANRLWEYINSSQQKLGTRPQIFILRNIWSNFRDSAFAVQPLVEKIMGHVSGRRRTTPAIQLYSLLVKWKIQETLVYTVW